MGGVIANGELHLSGKIVIKDNTCTKTYNGNMALWMMLLALSSMALVLSGKRKSAR